MDMSAQQTLYQQAPQTVSSPDTPDTSGSSTGTSGDKTSRRPSPDNRKAAQRKRAKVVSGLSSSQKLAVKDSGTGSENNGTESGGVSTPHHVPAWHRIYPALGSRTPIWGCDRELFLINLLIAAALILLSGSWFVTIITIVVSLLLFQVLRLMGKKDLLLRQVFIRQLHYRPYYLAQGGLHSPCIKRYLK